MSRKLATNLWFDKEGEEAARFYTGVFRDSKMGRITRYPKAGHDVHKQPEGAVLTVEFELEGSPFVALNAGPVFKFNEAISVVVNCDTQQEIDYYWEKLSAGGDKGAQQCGWLKDKYGLSWQVNWKGLPERLADGDKAKVERIFAAMMRMKKIDIAALEKAFEGP